ncbi:hypothetical protein IFM89_003936 [Coptis chinensis]|uniref:F-box domain-containing protein n=1 Tax=Coptis chinensis TaxID=261450 RepID=A0A835HNM7_9MAGN|nr:hypothetical protein IFM89_003936 [Coptis chinensis]
MSLKSLQTKSMENLPAEVIQEIFSRLPITSLFENRYVCQTWHGLINDRRLSFMHYVQASRRINPTTSLILYNGPGLYYIPDFNTCQNVVVFNNLPFKSWLPYFKVVASQNGFICVAADGCSYRNIFICNPVIGEWFLVPRSETLYGTNYGFGYELETNEYKIVRMRFCKDEDNYDVEIHKLGTSTWRDIGKVKRIIGDDPGASGVLENGEILVEINNGALVSYNQKRKSYREIIINGLPGSFKAVPHVGTLLPLMHAIQTVDCGN